MAFRLLALFFFASALVVNTSSALADEAFGESQSALPRTRDALEGAKGDGVYGRFETPWALRVAPLYEYQAPSSIHRLGIEGSVSYLQSAGFYYAADSRPLAGTWSSPPFFRWV